MNYMYMQRMYSNSGMAGLHHTTVLFSVVLGLASIINGVSSTQTCIPQTLFSSHNVHAYDEHPRLCLSGCVSAAPSDTDLPEVHIINVRSSPDSTSSSTSSTDSESDPQNVADLHFKPKQAGFFARSLVFILNSATPRLWRVKGEGMFSIPSYTITIMAPNHSCQSVTWNSEISQSVSVICLSLPQNNSDLLNFVQQQYSDVSTFSEVLDANAFSLLVGAGITTPSSCLIQPDFQTADFSARNILEQPITGCQTPELPGPLQTEFHIIFLKAATGAPTTSTSEPPVITVDLQPKRSSDSTREIVLALVSEANVTWRMKALRRPGKLRVITPNSVDMREDQMNLVERTQLPRDADGLLAWAEMEDWPLTTFTSAEMANKFVIILEHNNAPIKEPLSQFSIIMEYTKVDCHRDGIQARIRRTVMEIYKLTADNMMLRDHSCKAVESGEYYVIDTQRDQCGTTMTVMDTGRVVYHNEVIFSNSESVMEGSGESDIERLMGGLPVDDEQSLTTQIPFTCEYGSNGEVLTGDLFGYSKPQITITMDMYTGNNFFQKEMTFPHTVQTGERVYFEVALSDNLQLNIVPSQCWLSTGWEIFTQQLHMLIYKGCSRDESLIFHRDVLNSGQSRHFSYEAPDVQWEAMYYIHCELGICSDDGTGSNMGIPLCANIMDPETGCLVVNKHNGLVVDFPTQSLYLGPFKTMTSSIATPNEGNSVSRGVDDPEDLTGENQGCEVEGLSTGPAAIIAVVSFIMGMVLMGALWFIHTHTGPHTGPPPSASPCTVSTASSPSANGHLMNGHIPNGAITNSMIPNGIVPNSAVPNGTVPNGYVPSSFMTSKLNPNGIPLQGMRHVDPLPEEV